MNDKSDKSMVLGISPQVWAEMMFVTKRAMPKECSGLGTVECTEKGQLFVSELHLIPQANTSSHTQFDGQGLVDFMSVHLESLEKIKLWWHSHAAGGVFWSPEDRGTIERLRGIGNWLVSVVVNAKGDYKARLDMKDPVLLSIQDVELSVEESLSKDRRIELLTFMQEKFTDGVEFGPKKGTSEKSESPAERVLRLRGALSNGEPL